MPEICRNLRLPFDAFKILCGDFTNILNYPPTRYKGIIAFQVKNHPEVIPHLMRRLLSYLALHHEMDFYKGKLILLEVHRIRIQK